MAYTPTTWVTGDTVTATKMNKLEQGVANAGGYDAEIIIYHDNNSSHEYQFTLVSGSYASLQSIFANNSAPNVLVRIYDEMLYFFGATTNVYFYGHGNNGRFDMVLNIFAQKWNGQTFAQASWWSMIYLKWSTQDNLYLD